MTRNTRLTSNEMGLYVHFKKNKGMGTNTLTFSKDAEFVEKDFLFFSIAENTLTGDFFILFAKDNAYSGVLLNSKSFGGRIGTQKNNVVQFVLDKLKISYAGGAKTIIQFSENVSNKDDVLTYRLILNK
jgi:hypothetical protein